MQMPPSSSFIHIPLLVPNNDNPLLYYSINVQLPVTRLFLLSERCSYFYKRKDVIICEEGDTEGDIIFLVEGSAIGYAPHKEESKKDPTAGSTPIEELQLRPFAEFRKGKGALNTSLLRPFSLFYVLLCLCSVALLIQTNS